MAALCALTGADHCLAACQIQFQGVTCVLCWMLLLQVPAAASGLIAGDGIWSIPAAILAITKVAAPICMSFARAGTV